MGITISPSILNCDIANLRGELQRIANADYAHVDVMDNHFVPNLTWGLPVAQAVVDTAILPVDAHLMIANPDHYAPAYAEVGCASVTFHAEAAQAPIRLARQIRRLGAKAGLALRPATPVEPFLALLPEIDLLLVMTVEPGFGGQDFLSTMMPKVSLARKAVSESGLQIGIQVDGGVNSRTIEIARDAGADVFVAGSAVFQADNPSAQVDQLRTLASAASSRCC